MSRRDSVGYTVAFAGAVCVVCAVMVSSAAVLLRDRQQANVELDRRRNVLLAAGRLAADEPATPATIEERFAAFEVVVIELESGREVPDFEMAGYDPRRALSKPDTSRSVERNTAQVQRVPVHALAYRKRGDDGDLEMLVLPIEGKGLWGTMYGFLALGPDLSTVRGLTYYEHKETPGLGGEVDNPRWKALWPGREAFDADGHVALEVIRGRAGTAEEDPHRVDGLSGATITGRGVTAMLEFWLGENGYGPFLKSLERPRGGEVRHG